MADEVSTTGIRLDPPPSKADIKNKALADEAIISEENDVGETVECDITSTNCPTSAVSTTSIQIEDGAVTFSSGAQGQQLQSLPQSNSQPYQHTPQYWVDRQKPVKEKNLKVYKIVSVVAIILFFPLGIPAFWNSLKLDSDFHNGVTKGDMSACNKRALRVNKLLILSFTCSLFTALVTLALIGGINGDTHHSYTTGIHL